MRWPAIVLLTACLTACGGSGGSHPQPDPAPVSTTVAPLPNAPALAKQFNTIVGATNNATYAFAARLAEGLPADAVTLPADMVALASTAAGAWSNAAVNLQQSIWPPALAGAIDTTVSAIKTFAADMQLLSNGLSAGLFAAWHDQFSRDGQNLNGAENEVRALLGLRPIPVS